MTHIPPTGRYALLALLVLSGAGGLLAAAPASAQVNDDDFSLELRTLLAALSSAEEAADAFDRALDPPDTTATTAVAARRLRQDALAGAVEAARADVMLETVAALREEGGAEAPLSADETELRGLLRTLQRYGDDLVEVQGCEEGRPPLNYAAIYGAARPTLDRIRELGDLIARQVQTDLGRPEERP